MPFGPPIPPAPPTMGQVWKLLTFQCAVSPFFFIGLAGVDGIKAFWSIISPNWKDTIKMGPQKSSWIHQMKVIFTDAEEVKPAWFVVFAEGAFLAFELLDIFAFWFMLAYVVEETLLQWTSQIWPMSSCADHPQPYYASSKSPSGPIVNNTGQWELGPLWFNVKSNAGIDELSADINFPPNVAGTLVCSVSYTSFSGPDLAPVDMRILQASTGAVVFDHPYNFEHHDAKGTNAVYMDKIFTGPAGETYIVEVRPAGPNFPLICEPLSGTCDIQWEALPA